MIDAPARRTPPAHGGSAGLQLWLMMTLTFVTGVVDAVGYLALDKVFTGNMTGNIVILAMGLVGGNDLPVLGPLVALVSFAAGAALAGYVLRKRDGKWGWHVTCLLGSGAALLGLIAAAAAVGPPPSPPIAVLIACLVALQMGSQALVARKLAVRDMTTVVVTSTLTSLAGESFLHGGLDRIWNRRAGAILAIFAGAGMGTLLLLQIGLAAALASGSVLTFAVVFAGHKWRNPEQTDRIG